jgi:hypothetical protein
MHWLGYDIGKVRRNISVVTVQVNSLVYIETNTLKYRIFCFLTRKTFFVTTLAERVKCCGLC